MAGEIQIGGTTFATESGGTITVANVNNATNRINLGLGSIATQAAESVSISGGNITGGTIGSGVVFPTFVGMIASFAMSSAPSGWLVCNGAEYAIADYGDLHTAIGTTWGALTNGSGGAGSTHFRVPDLRGEFLRGFDNGQGNDPDAASRTGGDAVGSSQLSENASHTHTFRYNNTTVNADYGDGGDYLTGKTSGLTRISNPGTDARTGDMINNSGGNESRPRNKYVQYCIKY